MKARVSSCANIFWLVTAFFFSSQWRLHTAQAKPIRKSVVDYYRQLPNSYFDGQHTAAQRRAMLSRSSAGTVVDINNDYLRTELDSLGTLEIAVFRYKGNDLIGVRRYYEGCTIWFFRYQSDRWKDVTKSVVPTPLNKRLNYVLPRYGTTIEVRRDMWPKKTPGPNIYDLIWRKGRFQRRN